MTNGSSQGLFVIVAVVIFGIFVLISYVLFRDNLKVGLASIFGDSTEQALNDLNYKRNVSVDDMEGEFKYRTSSNQLSAMFIDNFNNVLNQELRKQGLVLYKHSDGSSVSGGTLSNGTYTREVDSFKLHNRGIGNYTLVSNENLSKVLAYAKSPEFKKALSEEPLTNMNDTVEFRIDSLNATGDFKNIAPEDIEKVKYNGTEIKDLKVRTTINSETSETYRIDIPKKIVLDSKYLPEMQYAETIDATTSNFFSKIPTDGKIRHYSTGVGYPTEYTKTILDLEKLYNNQGLSEYSGRIEYKYKNVLHFESENPIVIEVHFKNGFVLKETITSYITTGMDGIDTSQIK